MMMMMMIMTMTKMVMVAWFLLEKADLETAEILRLRAVTITAVQRSSPGRGELYTEAGVNHADAAAPTWLLTKSSGDFG